MTLNDLQSMAPAERVEAFKGHPIEVVTKMGLDGSAKVGDPNAVKTVHRPLCRGFGVGPWCDSEEEARAAGQDFLDNWNGELT